MVQTQQPMAAKTGVLPAEGADPDKHLPGSCAHSGCSWFGMEVAAVMG